MCVHESLEWAFQAMSIADEILPKRGRDFTPDWDGLLNAINEGHLQISVNGLLEQIELLLKDRLASFMQKRHGPSWWATLPDRVRHGAASRHRWSTAQLGSRAVTRYPDAAWLTMGEVILVLDDLSVEDWRACLDAESRRKSEFRKVFYRIKGFRDYYIAHPKPYQTSTTAMIRLCSAVQRIPAILRPVEWKKAGQLIDAVHTLPKAQRSRLHYEFCPWTKNNRRVLEELVVTLPLATHESFTERGKVTAKEKAWRTALLRSCAKTDSTGKLFFRLGAEENEVIDKEQQRMKDSCPTIGSTRRRGAALR
jgi:hypothetical protein